MSRITALEFRQNLKKVLARVEAGEEIVVTCRGKAVRLVLEHSAEEDMAGLDALLALTPFTGADEEPGSFDERYAQHLEEKYGK